MDHCARKAIAADSRGRRTILKGLALRCVYTHLLPLVDDNADETHPKVAELRELVTWCDGMVWSSPERHGAMTGNENTD